MAIDPVVLLVEEIRTLEAELRTQCKLNSADYTTGRMELVNVIVARVRALYTHLLETVPSSALGAGELLHIAATRLPFSHSRYASHLHRVSDRLGAGQRLHTDLVWLRALAEALADDAAEPTRKTAALIALAVKGIAQPVVVYRAAMPQQPRHRDLRELSDGPLYPPFYPPPLTDAR